MERRELLPIGYEAFNGHVFTSADCAYYNRLQSEINRWIDAGRAVPEHILDESHRAFVTIIS